MDAERRGEGALSGETVGRAVSCQDLEGRYRAVVTQLPEGMLLFEATGKRIVEATPALCRLLGYRPEELAGRILYDLIAHDRASIDANIARIVATGHQDIGLRRYRRRDGTLVTVAVSAAALIEAERTLLCAVVRDVTEQERLTAALRTSEAQRRMLVETVPAILFTLDAAGVITFAAGRGLAAMGLTAEQIIGRAVFVLARPPAVPDHVCRALAGEKVVAPMLVGDRLFETHYDPLCDDNGSIIGVTGVALDITSQTRAEAILRRQAAGLTDREQDVLAQLAADPTLSYAAIGARLCIARTTVITHTRVIADKLRLPAADRSSIVAAARARGLLDDLILSIASL